MLLEIVPKGVLIAGFLEMQAEGSKVLPRQFLSHGFTASWRAVTWLGEDVVLLQAGFPPAP